MLDVILDTLLDGLKLLPFLFVAFLVIELVEHKLSKKNKSIISKAGRFSPVVAAFLGLFPQCGFSVMVTNLYITRIVSLGTLIAVYLSTSDEMLPILLSEKADFGVIFQLLGIKLVIAIIVGFLIDFLIRRKEKEKINYHICDEEHCHCSEGVLRSALVHTMKTLFFILIVTFLLNTLLFWLGEEAIEKLLLKNSLFTPFIASFIGLIPNCAASIMLTELFLNHVISFASLIAGLLTGSGVAILVLFKSNKNMKENFLVLTLIYLVGAFSGLLLEIFQFFI